VSTLKNNIKCGIFFVLQRFIEQCTKLSYLSIYIMINDRRKPQKLFTELWLQKAIKLNLFLSTGFEKIASQYA